MFASTRKQRERAAEAAKAKMQPAPDAADKPKRRPRKKAAPK